jgi:hypothetical protein
VAPDDLGQDSENYTADILSFTESTPTLADISPTDKHVNPAALRSFGM